MEIVYYLLGHPVGIQTFLLGYSLVGGCRDFPLQRSWLWSVTRLCNGSQYLKDAKSCSCIFQKHSEVVFALPLLSARIMRLPEKARKVFLIRNQFTPSLPFYTGSALVECQFLHS